MLELGPTVSGIIVILLINIAKIEGQKGVDTEYYK